MLSTPPRLSASFQIFVRATRSTASCSSASEERDHAAEVLHLACRDRVAGVRGQARGRGRRSTRGWRSRNDATAMAFAQCRSIRTASVFTPRSTSQASNGPGIAPSDFCRNASRSAIASSFVAAKPPMTSEWPPRYFVVECSDDVRAERERLLEVRRRERVVDDDDARRRACAASDAAAMSTMLSAGFVGVSSQTNCVRSSRCSASSVEISLRREEREAGSPSARTPA